MIPTSRHKGFILVLVIAIMPLIGMAGIVLTSNSRQMLAVTTRAALSTHAQLACESGIAWIAAGNSEAMAEDQSIVLGIEHKNKIITCTIERVCRTDQQSVFMITGNAQYSRFSANHQERFILHYETNAGAR